jgi:hypothetical protein
VDDIKKGDQVWMFGFKDESIIGFSPEDISIDFCELRQDPKTLHPSITLFKTKNKAIESMIIRLNELKNEVEE